MSTLYHGRTILSAVRKVHLTSTRNLALYKLCKKSEYQLWCGDTYTRFLYKLVSRSPNDKQLNKQSERRFTDNFKPLDAATFENLCDETLDHLAECFEDIIEKCSHLKEADVNYGDGVLTVKFGNSFGTYVINRQLPNKQIWLSSPYSGPKRYDYIDGQWVYSHDGISLHNLLNKEISHIAKITVDFS